MSWRLPLVALHDAIAISQPDARFSALLDVALLSSSQGHEHISSCLVAHVMAHLDRETHYPEWFWRRLIAAASDLGSPRLLAETFSHLTSSTTYDPLYTRDVMAHTCLATSSTSLRSSTQAQQACLLALQAPRLATASMGKHDILDAMLAHGFFEDVASSSASSPRHHIRAARELKRKGEQARSTRTLLFALDRDPDVLVLTDLLIELARAGEVERAREIFVRRRDEFLEEFDALDPHERSPLSIKLSFLSSRLTPNAPSPFPMRSVTPLPEDDLTPVLEAWEVVGDSMRAHDLFSQYVEKISRLVTTTGPPSDRDALAHDIARHILRSSEETKRLTHALTLLEAQPSFGQALITHTLDLSHANDPVRHATLSRDLCIWLAPRSLEDIDVLFDTLRDPSLLRGDTACIDLFVEVIHHIDPARLADVEEESIGLLLRAQAIAPIWRRIQSIRLPSLRHHLVEKVVNAARQEHISIPSPILVSLDDELMHRGDREILRLFLIEEAIRSGSCNVAISRFVQTPDTPADDDIAAQLLIGCAHDTAPRSEEILARMGSLLQRIDVYLDHLDALRGERRD